MSGKTERRNEEERRTQAQGPSSRRIGKNVNGPMCLYMCECGQGISENGEGQGKVEKYKRDEEG